MVSVANKGGTFGDLPSGVAPSTFGVSGLSQFYMQEGKSHVMEMTKYVLDGLRVRKGPGTDTEHIASLVWEHGASILVAEERGDWVKLCPSMYEDRLRQSPDFKPHSPNVDGWCLRRYKKGRKKVTYLTMDAAEQRKWRIARNLADAGVHLNMGAE